MKSSTFLSFGNELTKIAFFEKVSIGFMQALKEGWHGTPEQQANKDAPTWMGKGMNMRGRMDGGNFKPLSRAGRFGERLTSLGGLTKALPVGAKTMTVLPALTMLPAALKREDPNGLNRSRTERTLGVAGSTIGGLAGSAMGARMMPRSPLLGPLLGGVAGSFIGEKATSIPFAARRAKMQQPQPQPQQMYQQPAVNPYGQGNGI
jgi:hypothetical protein